MLVFLSDLHLKDGTSGETINSGAFRKFTHYLEDMVLTAKANEVEEGVKSLLFTNGNSRFACRHRLTGTTRTYFLKGKKQIINSHGTRKNPKLLIQQELLNNGIN